MSDNINNHSDFNTSDKKSGSQDQEPKKYFDSLSDKYRKLSHILYIALVVCFLLTLRLINTKRQGLL